MRESESEQLHRMDRVRDVGTQTSIASIISQDLQCTHVCGGYTKPKRNAHYMPSYEIYLAQSLYL